MNVGTFVARASGLTAGLTSKLHRKKAQADLRQYMAGGQLPWTPGYHTHKENIIRDATRNPAWNPYDLPNGYGWRLDERVVEYPWFFSRLEAGPGRLLDAGSILNFEYLITHPKVEEKDTTVFTLAPEGVAFWEKGVSYTFGDMREVCFRDGWFDAIVCISTLEHVGLDNTMLYTGDAQKNEDDLTSYLVVLKELNRILRPGGRVFLSVPFGRAENHGWFQVFDADLADTAIAAFGGSQVTETIYRYTPDGWTTGTREEAKDAEYFDIHKKKTYDPDHAAASRAVICLEMVK